MTNKSKISIYFFFVVCFFLSYENFLAQCNNKMEYMAEVPFPIARANKNNLSYCAAALDSLKSRMPFVSKVQIGFNISETDTSDWLDLLNLVQSKGLKMIVSMQDPAAGYQYRPVVINNNNTISFDYGKLGEFIKNKNCISHPALFAVNVIDEPFHQSKGVYKNSWLKQIYQELKSLAGGIDFKIYINFSRMIWNYHYQNKDNLGGQGANPDVFYSEGICDIVQISTLEFQNGTYLWDKLDGNHYYSRKIIQYYTPNIPLWTSIQTFGGRLGSGNTDVTYWFPRPDDLKALMDSVVNSRYQSIKPLNGMTFQLWDSPDEQTRKIQFTLGDVVFKESTETEKKASADAIETINKWISDCLTSVENEKVVTAYILYQNYPNPFNPSTKIRFSIPQRKFITLKIFDVLGREVATLVDGELFPGRHSAVFNAKGLASGIYIYQLKTNDFVLNKKLILMK